jgi:hypothetical protein
VIWTTPELSVKNVIHLLLKALPHNCIATTIEQLKMQAILDLGVCFENIGSQSNGLLTG